MEDCSDREMEGCCWWMCPESEMDFRQRHGLIHPLETIEFPRSSATKRRGDRQRMVKVYSRSAAGTEHMKESLLRPFSVLRTTVQYLLNLANEYSDSNWTLVYEFVCDRLRAVRQDMIIQRLCSRHCLQLLEAMIPFYLVAQYKCESGACPGYDRKLHLTQLEECFSRWKEVYLLIGSSSRIPLCYLLHYAHKTDIYQEYVLWTHHLDPMLRRSIADAILAFKSNNFYRYFRILSSFPIAYLRCSGWEHIGCLRLKAFQVLGSAFRSPTVQMKLTILMRWLAFDSIHDVAMCLQEVGYHLVNEDTARFDEKTTNTSIDVSGYHWKRCDQLLALDSHCFTE